MKLAGQVKDPPNQSRVKCPTAYANVVGYLIRLVGKLIWLAVSMDSSKGIPEGD